MEYPGKPVGNYILGSRDVLNLKTVLREQDPPSDQFGHSRIWKEQKVLVVRSDCKKFAQ